jgi:molybdate transport system substrate-binding protein
MKKMRKHRVLLLLLMLVLVAAVTCSCGADKPENDASEPEMADAAKADLIVSAAASLKGAMTEIQELYIKENPNVEISISFGGSGSLQQQIEQGAPVDVFVSAATKNMNALKDQGLLINSTITDLLKNTLVLITASDSSLNLSDFTEATDSVVKALALGEPETVPAGKYAEQVFTFYNMLDAVKERAVYAKDVTEVLNWVAIGNADAGVVYSTDAASTDKVKIAAVAPEESHDPIVYPGAVIKASKQAEAAGAFLEYLSSATAKAVFEKYGFTVM